MTDPGGLLPQRPSPARDIERGSDWIFEPYWHGERLLAFVERGVVVLADERGSRVDHRFSDAAEIVAGAIRADQAIVDGVWAVDGPAVASDSLERTFMAVDLVALDGEELFDVPLLERRRLLEAVVAQSERVRVSPAIRQPIGSSLGVWREQGFRWYVAKHANSRYLPGQRNPEWLRMSAEPARERGLLAGMLGVRSSREPRIEA